MMDIRELVERGEFLPRFYIVRVANYYSIRHRETHNHLESYETVEELVEKIEEYNQLSTVEMYEYLYKNHGRMPKDKQAIWENYKEEEDRWYRGAWKPYTISFYEEFPHLYLEEKTVPYAEISDMIRKSKQQRWRLEKERQKEMERIGKEMDEAEKEKPKRKAKAKPLVKPKIVPKKKPIVKPKVKKRITKKTIKAKLKPFS